jgi:hypothetical protein
MSEKTIHYTTWLAREISNATNGYKKQLLYDEKTIQDVTDWASYHTIPENLTLAEAVKLQKKSKENIKIYKIADKTNVKTKEDDIPNAETLSLYIDTLKLCLKDNPDLDKKLANLIEKLPSPRKVRQDFSHAECRIIYETIGYLWKQITGKDIIEESKIQRAPESLFGNYWMLSNGVLLNGPNHFSIIKQNLNLFSSLLNIGGFTLQHYLHVEPNKLIQLAIKHGAMRMFITKDKRLYVQMTPRTYREWGKEKIIKLDFPKKVVRVIDLDAPYKGWNSGVYVKLD